MRPKLSLVSMATLIATSPALAQTCLTVANPTGLDHGGIEQMELAQFEAQTGTGMVFTDNPDLADALMEAHGMADGPTSG